MAGTTIRRDRGLQDNRYLKLDGTNIPTANYVWNTSLTTTGNITATIITGTTSGVFGGTLTIASGSITDTTGVIDFDDEDLTTTGIISGGTLTDGTATITGGVGAGFTTITATTSVTAGTLTIAGGLITDTTGAISFGNENLTTTGNIDAATYTIGGAAFDTVFVPYVGATALVNLGAWGLTTTGTGTFGDLIVDDGIITLEPTFSPTTGVIYKGTDSFIHNFQHPTGSTIPPVGQNTFIGVGAGNFTMGSTAIANYHGSYNVGIGYGTLEDNSWGYYNLALGRIALNRNTIGHENTAIGAGTLFANTSGNRNTGIGTSSLTSNTQGDSNVAIGRYSLQYNQDGDFNTAVGTSAGRSVAYNSPSENSLFGYASGYNLTTGGSNVFLGHKSGYNQTINSNRLIIDNQDRGNVANELAECLIYGYFDNLVANQWLRINGELRGSYGAKIGDGGTTNYTEIKTDGEIELRGTARVERHHIIGAASLRKGAVEPGSGWTGLYPTLDFANGKDDAAHYVIHVPYRRDVLTNMTVELRWMHDTGADTGTVLWKCTYLSAGCDDDPTGAGTEISVLTDGNHPADALQCDSMTTDILAANLTEDDDLALKIWRNDSAGGDTLGESARLVSVHVHFIQNKIGKST